MNPGAFIGATLKRRVTVLMLSAAVVLVGGVERERQREV